MNFVLHGKTWNSRANAAAQDTNHWTHANDPVRHLHLPADVKVECSGNFGQKRRWRLYGEAWPLSFQHIGKRNIGNVVVKVLFLTVYRFIGQSSAQAVSMHAERQYKQRENEQNTPEEPK